MLFVCSPLCQLGLTLAQITSIAGLGSGHKNIDAVKMSFNELNELGFTPAQITSIAGHDGGSKTLMRSRCHLTN